MGKANVISKSFSSKSHTSKSNWSSKSFSSSGFVFTDPDAQIYYDALVVANGGNDINTLSLYGITLDFFKEFVIETRIVNLKASGAWAKGMYLYLYMGGTADTHAVNFIDGTTQLSHVGSPTQDANGTTLNGTTQYCSVSIDLSSDFTPDDISSVFLFDDTVNGLRAIGAMNSSSQRFWNYNNNKSSGGADSNNSTVGGGRNTYNNPADDYNGLVMIASRTSATAFSIYVDGTDISMITTDGGSLPTVNPAIGACNNGGSIIYLGTGTIKAGGFFKGLSATEADSLTTEIKAIQTLLGR